MPSLFYPGAQWAKILALDLSTAKGRVFHALSRGGWIPGDPVLADAGGYDYRTRCARLRDLGIPVETEPSKSSPCYLYRIPPAFLEELDFRRRKSA